MNFIIYSLNVSKRLFKNRITSLNLNVVFDHRFRGMFVPCSNFQIMITCVFKHSLMMQNFRTEQKLCQGAISTKKMEFSALPFGKLNTSWRWLSTQGNV